MDQRGILSAVFVGEGALLVRCAELFREAGHTVSGIVSSDARACEWAEARGLRCLWRGADLVAELGDASFDYLFILTNAWALQHDLLSLSRRGAIEYFNSFFPKYAGPHAASWAILRGEPSHGITWHQRSMQLDRGRILLRSELPIHVNETAASLHARCYEAAVRSFPEVLTRLMSSAHSPVAAHPEDATYFPDFKRPQAGGLIPWDGPAEAARRVVGALTFDPLPNPLTLPKIMVGGAPFLVRDLAILPLLSASEPGTVLALGDEGLRIATQTRAVEVATLQTLDGDPVAPPGLASRHGLRVGQRLETLDEDQRAALTHLHERVARHEAFWLNELANLRAPELPHARHDPADGPPAGYAAADLDLEGATGLLRAAATAAEGPCEVVLAGFVAYLLRSTGQEDLTIGFCEPALRESVGCWERFFALPVPLSVHIGRDESAREAMRKICEHLSQVRRHETYARDLVPRHPALRDRLARLGGGDLPVVFEQVQDPTTYAPPPGSRLTLAVSENGLSCRWLYDAAVYSPEAIAGMQREFLLVLNALAAQSDRPLAALPRISEDERLRLLVDWNETTRPFDASVCVPDLIEAQVDRTPDAIALASGDQELTYRELDERANRLAHHLRRLKVGTATLVGVCLDRSPDLVVALLAIHKAGGAYVPLDPGYPRDRLRLMIEDAAPPVIVTSGGLAARLPATDAALVWVDGDAPAIAREPATRLPRPLLANTLAYVIYTSGSTGRPKGVMIGHRNLVSFFAGMEERLPFGAPSVWLATTSVSFDISVLELLWTLAHGFKVVLYANDDQAMSGSPQAPKPAETKRAIDFSLFYFASDGADQTPAKYRLLIEGAKFADRNGFAAVWTPERHFHAFGGLYPNPAITAAAVAMVTERVQIRAGSCVLPLHNPIRVAEEWSLVDNLSNGRVGISFASGWHPDDFALAPDNFADRRGQMVADLDTVRRLWRGEALSFRGGKSDRVRLRTLPRPIQPELPFWVTASGNPETYRLAGELGANLLTHLLGQSVDELAEKLALYRAAWLANGHPPAGGRVTLMLHTLVGSDRAAVRALVREPMKQYLRSSVDLIEKAAWNFSAWPRPPADEPPDLSGLDAEGMEALLEHAFERYFETSGLFGTPEDCLALVDRLGHIGVDEIACLIDFGVDSQVVLESLSRLDELRRLAAADARPSAPEASIASLIERHGVTHMQCTPSLASMLLLDDRAREALSRLRVLLVGGEALPGSLARELRSLVSGEVLNMYGPTETTIWSSTYALDSASPYTARAVPIGRPIANTEFYILDETLQPVPIGAPGELFIGGEGLACGYLRNPELTDERFIAHPFSKRPGARLYRTGDLAAYRPDGNVEFLGRLDNQVKLRGYRIELGEIETLLNEQPSVREAIVVAREDTPGDQRLVAYVTPRVPDGLAGDELREVLRARLPSFMVPADIVVLPSLPLTLNGKVDRRALPAPERVEPGAPTRAIAPRTDLEQAIATIWQEVLRRGNIGVHDNFFRLGGHSLTATQVAARLRSSLGLNLSLGSLFATPTIAELAAEIERLRAERTAATAPAIGRVARGLSRAVR